MIFDPGPSLTALWREPHHPVSTAVTVEGSGSEDAVRPHEEPHHRGGLLLPAGKSYRYHNITGPRQACRRQLAQTFQPVSTFEHVLTFEA